MKADNQPKRRTYDKFGRFLNEARKRLHDDKGQILRVQDIAKQLDVTVSFVYQVEQGKRKPKDGDFFRWASVYRVSYVDLWKCLARIPLELVATLRDQSEPITPGPFSRLTEDQKSELLPFLDYVQWKTAKLG